MDDVILTRQEMAKKIVGLRDIRLDIEKLKLKAKKTEQTEEIRFQELLADIEKNYDLYKAKLTKFAVSDDEELREIKHSLDEIWSDLHLSVQAFDEYLG